MPLLVGAASAFAFEPVGWWPLMFVAFAVLCELLEPRRDACDRAARSAGRSASASSSVGLNWIATAFTFQSAMPPALGWVAVVLLSIYLAVYPAIATGLAWRFGRENRVVAAARPGRHLGDHRMAARDLVHRLSVEPGRRRRSSRPR